MEKPQGRTAKEQHQQMLREKDQENRQLQQQLMASNEALEKIISCAIGIDDTLDNALLRLQNSLHSGNNITHDLFFLSRERQSTEEQRHQNLQHLVDELDSLLDGNNPSLCSVKPGISDARNQLDAAGLSLVSREEAMKSLISVQKLLLLDLPSKVCEGSIDLDCVIGDQIMPVLGSLMDSMVVPDELKGEFESLKNSIHAKMKLQDLLEVLEFMRDLLQAVIHSSSYREYMDELVGKLEDIRFKLNRGAGRSTTMEACVEKFEGDLQTNLTLLEADAEKANDLGSLKTSLSSHLSQIRQAMENFHKNFTAGDEERLSDVLGDVLGAMERMEDQATEIQLDLEKQRNLALTDALTELPNRTAYRERSEQEYQRWKRYQSPLVIAMVDVDRFKSINDKYGHQAGDRVLKILSKVLSSRLRTTDYIARYGGEEFVILLPETDGENAEKTLNALREDVANCPFNFKEERVEITVSAGFSELKTGDTLETALGRADKALYAAKANGRNRVEHCP
ncbi:MAG: GGDEF domain-containing protein [Cellvibrionaceae bacterium]